MCGLLYGCVIRYENICVARLLSDVGRDVRGVNFKPCLAFRLGIAR